ncbi:response regulator [Gloeothece verrucosa]|uniref:Response regulator receiver protein n=1 Tax=Gloeothece verrucosa (strain PCC 7822) TaxID=497965 RepID=E0U8W3_GLOV7|nr:response regulator [Gloeothece verrucosa]ADN14977.1 response regulator receiver protein [Gloeothece verrucosa PCC 7822]
MITVLIVDDSPSLRQILIELLQKRGINVLEAASGMEAQEQIQKEVPDLVITDLIMPQMNGYELCRWIKNNPSTQDVPVLICSTKSEEFDRYWGMKQGADAYITKPFQPAEMLQTIKFLLQNRRKS